MGIRVYIDGASIGNPGKMGIGYLIYKDTILLKKKSFYLGIGTNNFAEYMALLASLIEVLSMGEKECYVYSDSNLLCEQLKGNFKVKSKNIYPLFVMVKDVVAKFKSFSINYISRENNKDADRLAKEAANFLTIIN